MFLLNYLSSCNVLQFGGHLIQHQSTLGLDNFSIHDT